MGEGDAVERHGLAQGLGQPGPRFYPKSTLPICGEKSQYGAAKLPINHTASSKNDGNPPFFEIGTVPAILVFIRRKGRWNGDYRGFDMTATSTFSQRLLAAFVAFSMSTFMVVASFAPPSAHAVQAMYA
jgi:hypothetical protein